MGKFFLHTSMLLIVLLFGIIFGMYHAKEANQSEVVSTDTRQNVTTIERAEKKIEGKEQVTPTIEERPKVSTSQQSEHFNFFSELGTTVGEGFYHLFRSFLSILVDSMNEIIHGGK